MANGNHKTWRALAARASVHLATARICLDMILDGTPPEPIAGQVRGIEDEVHAAQDLVRQIAGVVPALLLAVLLVSTTRAQENWSYSDSLGMSVDVVLPYLLPPSCGNCIIAPAYWSVNGSTTFASNAPNTSGVFDFFVADSQITAVHFVVTDGSALFASVGAGSSLPVGDTYLAPGVDMQGPTGVWVDPPLPTVAAPELEDGTGMLVSISVLLCLVAIIAGRRT